VADQKNTVRGTAIDMKAGIPLITFSVGTELEDLTPQSYGKPIQFKAIFGLSLDPVSLV
jgi:hypothetical protein